MPANMVELHPPYGGHGQLDIVADMNALALRPTRAPTPPTGLSEVARHALSTPGRPRIELAR